MRLKGVVAIEAAYALRRGGTILSDAGGGVLSNNGANVVSTGGGGIIAVNGARLEAGGGRLVSDQGGGLIAAAQGNVVVPGGAGLAPELGDGTLLADPATGGTAFGLLADDAAGPAVGTELPAAGMRVAVVSLTDRRFLPLGEDAAGKPVYAVYSNTAGGFEVFVPAAQRGNVVVVASVPGQRDRRLALNVVTPAADDALAVDELRGLMSRFVRMAFTRRLVAVLRNPELAKAVATVEPSLTEAGRAELLRFVDALTALAAEAGLPAGADEAALLPVAQRLVDLGLAEIDLPALRIDAADVATWEGRAPLPVLDGFRAPLQALLAGAAARLRTTPGFFSQAWLETVVNAPDGDRASPPIGAWADAIRTPADVGEFVLVEYLSPLRVNVHAPLLRLFSATRAAQLAKPAGDPAVAAAAEEDVTLLYGAGMQVMVALAERLASDPALADQVRTILADAKP